MRIEHSLHGQPAFIAGYQFAARSLADEPAEVLQAAAANMKAELGQYSQYTHTQQMTALYGGIHWIKEQIGFDFKSIPVL